VAYCLRGASQQDVDQYVMINASEQDIRFSIPSEHAGTWRRVVHTSLQAPDDIVESGCEVPLGDPGNYCVRRRSVVVLLN